MDIVEYFIGIGLPPEEERLIDIVKQEFHPSGRLSSPAHITLVKPFYWRDEPGLIAKLSKWTKKQEVFQIRLKKVGSFRHKNYGTVDLVPDNSTKIKQLMISLTEEVRALPKDNQYIAHLTVAQQVPLEELGNVKQQIRMMLLELDLDVREITLYTKQGRESWKKLANFRLGV